MFRMANTFETIQKRINCSAVLFLSYQITRSVFLWRLKRFKSSQKAFFDSTKNSQLVKITSVWKSFHKLQQLFFLHQLSTIDWMIGTFLRPHSLSFSLFLFIQYRSISLFFFSLFCSFPQMLIILSTENQRTTTTTAKKKRKD